MKKFLALIFSILILFIPVVYADGFDTNIVGGTTSDNSSPSSNPYKYWQRYTVTGTRYIIRIYDWNSKKYIAVPTKYYVNHIYKTNSDGTANTSMQYMYLGVDKTQTTNATHDYVRSGSTIFKDNTYAHVLKWFDNSEVSRFGVTKNDINLIAEIIKEAASKNGDRTVVNNMQDVIDGVTAYDVRAEILFLTKPPYSSIINTATVEGKGSVERYSFRYYNSNTTSNKTKDWIKDYYTYDEIKAVAYAYNLKNPNTELGLKEKAEWYDKVACALFEQDEEYVFVNGIYQCSCDLYERAGYSYSLINATSQYRLKINDNVYSNGKYRYYPPGRCGIPITFNGQKIYITGGKTYNVGGKSIKIGDQIQFKNGNKYRVWLNYNNYLSVVTNDPNKAIIYEGWDYITNNLAATLVVAVDKDTGNIIEVNNVPYSEFESVGQGTYPKTAWTIPGYKYVGYLTKDGFGSPSLPIKPQSTDKNTSINITSSDVSRGAKKQVVFIYEKDKGEKKEVRLSIYKKQGGYNSLMYTGSYYINESKKTISINIFDNRGSQKYSKEVSYTNSGYIVNTKELENVLGIDVTIYKYLGYIIKSNPEVFLTYLGESLNPLSGNIYNLNDVGNNKVHIIIGYETDDDSSSLPQPPVDVVPPPVVEEPPVFPELKVSYMDNKGNTILPSETTVEEVGKVIIKTAPDMKSSYYVYKGYTYKDSMDEFENIPIPPSIISDAESVSTTFTDGHQRRHIAFVYIKIDIRFSIDIQMKVDDQENQYINQKENEDYWVLDEPGKVILKVVISGTENLTILSRTIKLRIPFDTYMNGVFVPANTINNLNINDINEIVVADKLMVPVWVTEKKYDITANLEVNVYRFGVVSSSKSDDVEVVGRLYDFTITNIDGSDTTGDEKWHESLFYNENLEYKANRIPIGQSTQQPSKYNYGIKLGTQFYFSVNTKGLKNDKISLLPKFLYVSEDGKTIKEVDIYVNHLGKRVNILSSELEDKYMKLRDGNILKSNVLKELSKAQEMVKASIDRYNYTTTLNRSLGKFSNVFISKFLSLPYVDYIKEFNELYGPNAMTDAKKTENSILTYVTHWYGKYYIPSTAKIVDSGANGNGEGYKDGYLIVLFKIISLDSSGSGYLSYELPTRKTQWERENLNTVIDLPIILNSSSGKQIVVNSLKDGYAPAIIYQVGVTTLDNNTSVGTH